MPEELARNEERSPLTRKSEKAICDFDGCVLFLSASGVGILRVRAFEWPISLAQLNRRKRIERFATIEARCLVRSSVQPSRGVFCG